MSGELSFGERISYETLLLMWLDRVNKALQFPQKIRSGTTDLSIWAISATEAVKALYYMLIPELRKEVDEKLGTPLPEYLSYNIRYADYENPPEQPYLYALRVITPDLYEKMKKELENAYEEREREKIIKKYYNNSQTVLGLRAREAVKVIVEVLHEAGLLLRERELFRGEV